MKIHLIHGIHTKDPEQSIGKLRQVFESYGYTVILHKYGFLWFFMAGLRNRRIAKKIARQVDPDDVLVMHSNGAPIGYHVAKRVPYDGAIIINGALDSDTTFDQVNWMLAYFTPGDEVVKLADMVPDHSWGDMGAVGYTGTDPKGMSVSMQSLNPKVMNHMDVFSDNKVWPWGSRMVDGMLVMQGKFSPKRM